MPPEVFSKWPSSYMEVGETSCVIQLQLEPVPERIHPVWFLVADCLLTKRFDLRRLTSFKPSRRSSPELKILRERRASDRAKCHHMAASLSLCNYNSKEMFLHDSSDTMMRNGAQVDQLCLLGSVFRVRAR